MESCDSGVTSPVLRVTAEISELKGNLSQSRENGKCSVSPSSTSKDGRANLFIRKKILNPLYGHNPYQRSTYAGSYVSNHQNPKNNVSTFTQRVMSAKLLRTKQLQNQLAETQMKLNEALHENKILRTLQHRQDSVLKKYEGNQEQLPQLLKSHHEEIRILNEKYKQLRTSYRELEGRMKQKDNELTNLREQYKHLLKLSRDKNLGEREKLTQKVEEMESVIEQQKNKIYNLDKKIQIEEKNHRYQLNQEVQKNKKLQSELNSALETISNLKTTIEAKERFASTSYPRFQQSAPTQTKTSHLSLPAPPRVSIRQTQRLAHSADHVLQQEDSETADSLTINYSPGEGGSSSMDSDNLSTGSKEDNDTGSKLQSKEGRNLAGMIPGSINISKEAFRERQAMRRLMSERDTKVEIPKDKKPEKVEITAQRRSLRKSSIQENNRAGIEKTVGSYLNGESPEKKSEVDIENTVDNNEHINNNTAQESNIKAYKHLETREDRIFTEIEKQINSQETPTSSEMKLEMDAEFDKLLESTKLSDEAISEYFNRDFKAEIQEIEKKFQDLDKASERYMKVNKNINGSSFHISLTKEDESDEDNIVYEDRNGDKDLLELLSNSDQKFSGPILGESQKATLLKALNNIDEATETSSQGNEECNDKIQKLEIAKVKSKNSTVPVSNFSRTRRKSLIMKDLFGGEGTKL